jgi:competence protein ComFC
LSWKYHLYHLMWGCLDWIFPPECGGCNRVGTRWCPDCQNRLIHVPEPVCEICGVPLSDTNLCLACKNVKPPYKALRSWTVFEGPIRNALHKLKYRRNVALGITLAYYLVDSVRQLGWQADMIVPVPLGKKRLQERGYNQIGLVAMPLADLLGWRYAPRAITRIRETKSQVGLSAVERKENVSGVFQADFRQVTGKSILLMDDVTTTGATVISCTEALLTAGAGCVFAFTLSRALPRHGLRIV